MAEHLRADAILLIFRRAHHERPAGRRPPAGCHLTLGAYPVAAYKINDWLSIGGRLCSGFPGARAKRTLK
ncbi:MAG TPA: hypothetical protein VLT83_08960 [Opitutaceae bacterium]|nr:hypothetical protein [Opitutaceae bacterium]